MVFAIFAYGGIEAVGGLAIKRKIQKRTLPKVLFLPLLYFNRLFAGNIFMGRQHKLAAVLSNGSVNLGNITYVLMKSLG